MLCLLPWVFSTYPNGVVRGTLIGDAVDRSGNVDVGMSKMAFPVAEGLDFHDFGIMLVMFGPSIRARDDDGGLFRRHFLYFSFFTGNAPNGCWGFVLLSGFVCALHPPRLRGDDLVDEFAEEDRRSHNGDCFASVHGSYSFSTS